jgi:phospholipid/cholesterol/gamma-HCH transport system substrate-binding protein
VKISKEVRVGLLALVSGVMLYFGFNFLKGQELFSTNKKYYVVYPNISGLGESNAVTVNGKAVGKVEQTRLLINRNNLVLVVLEVAGEVRLNDSSYAKIDVDLLGNKQVILSVGRGNKIKKDGDTLLGRTPDNILGALQEKATPVIDTLSVTMSTLNRRLQEFQAVEAHLNILLKSLTATSNNLNSTLNENQAALRSITHNLNTLSASLNDPKTGIQPIMRKANTFADSLSRLRLGQTLAKTDATVENLNQIMAKINQGQGSLGKLIKNDSLHRAMVASISHLDTLFVDLKAHPKRYVHFSVFGNKEKKVKK